MTSAMVSAPLVDSGNVVGNSGASSVLALLDEEDDHLKIFALEQINERIDEIWFQLSGSISLVEALFEDEDFSHRELAALVASKVFYHLDDLDDALVYALGAQDLVDVTGSCAYSKAILSCCVDSYTSQRKVAAKEGMDDAVDPRLLKIVEKLFEKCISDGQFEQAVGLSVESHRLDMLEQVISRCSDPAALIQYTLKTTHKSITSKTYRDQILDLIVSMHAKIGSRDFGPIMKCLLVLDRPGQAGDLMVKLINGSDDDVLMAYQLGFDINESENQAFSKEVRSILAKHFHIGEEKEEDAPMEETAATETTALMQEDTVATQHPHDIAATRLDKILSGEIPMELERQFLARNNATDLQILKNIKATVEPRNSVCHGATVFANAMMNASTTNDSFLRDNLDWLAKATNWSKFSATSGLGVIHKGNIKNSKSVLSPYLPSSGSSSSPYSEGGSLYALGLIHSNHSVGIREYIMEFLQNTQNEVIQHGACLGLGIAGIGSEDTTLFEEIKNILYNDNAISGEAAGLAMGLLFAGTGTELSEEMLAYAHDTQHEKIIRGLAIGLASIQYGREEKADTMIEAMTLDQDAILRYGGMYAIGLAYCGTGDNSAIQKLLHFAVSDVSNDVRRAAVLCLGFVLAGNPDLCVRAVSLLAESYNPHVRYVASMAVGISGAGTGCQESIKLLQSLWKDPTDFVQQGSMIASAMILIEQPESRQEKLRERINQLHGNRGVELMTRMGSIMACGILDAAGRNSTLSLYTDVGGLRRSAVLGLALFTQYWYWYPLTHAISLALKPTVLIGVDATLAPPSDFKTKCSCSKSVFAYPAPVAIERAKSKEKVPKAVLSTSRKKAEKKEGEEEKKDDQGEKKDDDSTMEVDVAEEVKEDQVKEDSFEMGNPARVVPAQRKYIQLIDGIRWVPVRFQDSGIVVLKNTGGDEPVEYAFDDAKAEEAKENGQAEEDKPAEESPPEPFEYVPS